MSTSEDTELKSLMNKKLRELSLKAKVKAQPAAPPKGPREVLLSHLYDRGLEVLKAAELQYPTEMKAITSRLAELYQTGKLTSNISGGELLYLLRRIGLNVRIETSIRVEEHGKFVDLSEKLRGKE
jgi:DNA-binding TFAR19-related protein (PDSD5 family)